MALEAADDDLDVEIYDELDSYSKIFEELSLQLLEFGYQSDDDLTQHLLTGKLVLHWAQSFTSLKADLRQDINGGFAFSRCLKGTFP